MYIIYMNITAKRNTASTLKYIEMKAQLSDEVDMIRAGEKVRRMLAADIFPEFS